MELLRDAAADARLVQPDRPVELDTSEHLVVEADADRLRQVLANVVGNALVHTAPDVPLRLVGRRTPDAAVIEVADDGEGMPADVAARVTERFYRADPARSRARGGSGLGLAIVDAIVGAHGGAVEIDSSPGAGTTVRITLPDTSASR